MPTMKMVPYCDMHHRQLQPDRGFLGTGLVPDNTLYAAEELIEGTILKTFVIKWDLSEWNCPNGGNICENEWRIKVSGTIVDLKQQHKTFMGQFLLQED